MPRSGLRAARSAASPDAYGLTLLEMVVVLALLGIVLSLSVPMLVPPRAPDVDPLQRVFDAARRVALRRGQSLSLAVEADGRWSVEPLDSVGDAPLLSGRVEGASVPLLRVRISPLGGCWLEGDGTSALALDPLRCRLVRGLRS